MKHKQIDLASEVERASLPDGLEGFLFPMYEAISNALHSIEERWEDDLEDKGRLEIAFDENQKEILVADNGAGFNQNNLRAFLTPLTGNKFERGGKGFGRFMAFKIFKKVFYSPIEITEEKVISPKHYRYDPFSKEDNLIASSQSDGAPEHPYDRGLSVLMVNPLSDFEDYFDLNGQERRYRHDAEDIVSATLDHFLIEFIQKKVPKHCILTVENVRFNLYKFFNDSLRKAGKKKENIRIGDQDISFEYDYFKVGDDQTKKHRLYFYANNRASSDLENISSGLNKSAFTEKNGDNEKKYFYLVAVSSEYFKSSQSRDRIVNLHSKIDFEGRKKSLKDVLIDFSKQHILDFEKTYTADRRKNMASQVEHLISVDPLLRRGLGGNTATEFVKERGILETKEQLARDLFVERYRRKFDFSKLTEDASVEELVKAVRDKIPEDAKEALAVYVAYRNHVITIFEKLLNKTEEGVATENRVHQLIYPRYKDSEDIDYSSHNLWLLDDDLAYARYVSSDRTPKGKGRGKGDYAHDILINNEEELMIVEMKRPQKKGYNASQEGHTNNPVDQLKNQIADIRTRGNITSSTGREIPISKDIMVRGYILADWNDKLETYLKIEDYIISKSGGKMAYRYYGTLNFMIEVLAFDRLIDRARNRNEAFVQMLEGRSNYDRTPKNPLGSTE